MLETVLFAEKQRSAVRRIVARYGSGDRLRPQARTRTFDHSFGRGPKEGAITDRQREARAIRSLRAQPLEHQRRGRQTRAAHHRALRGNRFFEMP